MEKWTSRGFWSPDSGGAGKPRQSHLGRQLQFTAFGWSRTWQWQKLSKNWIAFRGAGWNVVKVIWGSDWDPLLEADDKGLLLKRMEEAVDGDYQKYSVEPGSYTEAFFWEIPRAFGNGQPHDRRADPKLLGAVMIPQRFTRPTNGRRTQGRADSYSGEDCEGYGLGETVKGATSLISRRS
jgi:hypothetical protein